MKIEEMSKTEQRLLLYLETRAVDYCGRVDARHMNEEDRKIAEAWNQSGFLEFGRIALDDVNANGSSWCHLSDEAWTIAHQIRKARGVQDWSNRRYKSTEEARAE